MDYKQSNCLLEYKHGIDGTIAHRCGSALHIPVSSTLKSAYTGGASGMRSRPVTFPHLGLLFPQGFGSGLTKRAALSIAPFLRDSVNAIVVALAYYAGSEVGFLLKPAHSTIATFWPPSAILLAAFLLAPTRMWWIFLLAIFPAHLVVQLPGTSLATTLGWFVANTSGAVLGAATIRRLKKENVLFDSLQGLVAFLLLGALLPAMVKSVLNATFTLQAARDVNYWILWTSRLFSNIIASLLLIPTIIIFARNGVSWLRSAKVGRYIEAFVLAFCIVTVSALVFRGETTVGMIAAIIVPVPFLLWAAFRFGLGGLSVSLLGVALISIWNTIHGQGPIGSLYAVHDILFYRVLFLDSLLIVFGVPLMLTAVLIAERRHYDAKLSEIRDELIYPHEQERLSIARELHTNVAGRLTLLAVNVDRFRTESNAPTRQTLDQLYSEIAGICKDTLDLSHETHPFIVDYLGLATALRKLCRNVAAQSAVSIEFSAESVPLSLPSNVSARLFHLAKVALRSIQHGYAKTANVKLEMSSGLLLLRIFSDRVDVGLLHGECSPITSIREQLLSLGGALHIMSSDSKELIIEASLPISVNR